MKVIFLEDVRNVAKRGEVKEVAEGYARNFLFPKKLAKIATTGSIAEVEAKKKKEQSEQQAFLEKMRELAKKLQGKNVNIKSKEKGGKLFGSISAKNIAQKLKDEGIEITEKNVILLEPIKMTGQYPIKIELSKEIETRINLLVTGEK